VHEAAHQAADTDLSEVSKLAGHLALDDHPDADALAVQDAGCQHGFNRMPDRVAKVDEIVQPGRLMLVIGHDVHFDRDRAHNNGEEQLLRCGAHRLCTSQVVHAGCLDGGDNLRWSRLEGMQSRTHSRWPRSFFLFLFFKNK